MQQGYVIRQPVKKQEKEVLSTGMVILRSDYKFDNENPAVPWSWFEQRYSTGEYIVKTESDKEQLERELSKLEIEMLKISK